MRVAIFGIKKLPAIAGADRVVEQILSHFTNEHQFTVYLIREGGVTLQCTPNFHYVYIPALRGKHLRAFSYFFLCAAHHVVKGKADAIHVHNSDFGVFSFFLKLRRPKVFIGTFHGNPYERTKWGIGARQYLRLSEWFFRAAADVLTSVSLRKAEELKLVVNKPVFYIPNGIDGSAGNVAELRGHELMKIGLSRNNYIMFACGRLDSTKGLHHLLRAYVGGGFEEKLLIVGDFSHDNGYAEEVERLCAGNSSIVMLKSLLPKPELLRFVSSSKVFVFPSEIEAMSMMLLEAISCKKLVVCSDIPENRELVGSDYAYMFRLGPDGDLRGKLRASVEDQHPETTTIPLYETCASRYAWGDIASEYLKLYSWRRPSTANVNRS